MTGGIAGFAAFGSIVSLAGFGFEQSSPRTIGLAGSLAGALAGLGLPGDGASSERWPWAWARTCW